MCRAVRLGMSGCSGPGGGCGCLGPGITSHLRALPHLMSERICWAHLVPTAALTSVTLLAGTAPQCRGSAGASGRFRNAAAAPAVLPNPPCTAGPMLPDFCKRPLGQAVGWLPCHAEAPAAVHTELFILMCFEGARVRCKVLPGPMLRRGLGVLRSARGAGTGDVPAAGGASAEFAAALQVMKLIESKCGSKALPSPMRRAGGERFISLLFPGCFEFSPFEKGGLSSVFT